MSRCCRLDFGQNPLQSGRQLLPKSDPPSPNPRILDAELFRQVRNYLGADFKQFLPEIRVSVRSARAVHPRADWFAFSQSLAAESSCPPEYQAVDRQENQREKEHALFRAALGRRVGFQCTHPCRQCAFPRVRKKPKEQTLLKSFPPAGALVLRAGCCARALFPLYVATSPGDPAGAAANRS